MRRRSGVAAVVTDAHLPSTVAAIRGFGRAGIDVVALGQGRGAAGLRSRYTRARVVAPGVREDRRALLAAAVAAASRHHPAVLYPGGEDSLEAMLDDWDSLRAAATLPYPSPEPVRRVRDKRLLPDLARAAGLVTPRVIAEGTAGELRRWAPPTPCVVKAAGPVGSVEFARVLRDADTLAGYLATLPDDQPLIVQALAAGPLIAIVLVIDPGGRVVARVQQQTVRTWPADAGPSAVAVTVAPDAGLVARVARMLAATGYWGLAQVQMMWTLEGPAPIDVNPRFYGSLALAGAAGVNLVEAWHRTACGERLPDAQPYRVGTAYRRLDADLVAAVRGDRARLRRPVGTRRVGQVWAADDPVAAGALMVESARERIRRRQAS